MSILELISSPEVLPTEGKQDGKAVMYHSEREVKVYDAQHCTIQNIMGHVSTV